MLDEIPIPAGLTQMQQTFCHNYINNHGNATKALRDAGYNCTTDNSWFSLASSTLRHVKVAEYITSLRTALQRESIVTTEEIVSGLREVKKRALSEEAVYDRDGNPTGEYKSDLNSANRAIELLGRTIGSFTDKTELTGANGAPIAPVQIYLPQKGSK